MDFFPVPTITFGVLYCFFIISHDRRRILHVNVTKHPTSGWIIQQLREAFPFEASCKYLIFDRDQKFGFEVIAAVKATRIIPKRTSFRSPWQNGIAERWVGSCRRDLLDHMVALNERHLKRLLLEYVRDHHADRTHLGLEKETPQDSFRGFGSDPFTGATRRAAPSLRSSRLVRIECRLVLYICVLHAHAGSPSSKPSCSIKSIVVFITTPPKTAQFRASAEILANNRAIKPARIRSHADRLGDRWRERFRSRSWCFRRSDSATTERTPPGPSRRTRVARKWMKRTTRWRIEEW